MSFQLTTCTSSVFPVFALYADANCVQNFAVLSFEYSAATSLIVVAFFAPLLLLSELAPVPPPQPARSTVRPQIPAESARERLFIEGLLLGIAADVHLPRPVGGNCPRVRGPLRRFVRRAYNL